MVVHGVEGLETVGGKKELIAAVDVLHDAALEQAVHEPLIQIDTDLDSLDGLRMGNDRPAGQGKFSAVGRQPEGPCGGCHRLDAPILKPVEAQAQSCGILLQDLISNGRGCRRRAMNGPIRVHGFQNNPGPCRLVGGNQVRSVKALTGEIGLDDIDGGMSLVKFEINEAIGQDQTMILDGKGRDRGLRRSRSHRQEGEQD